MPDNIANVQKSTVLDNIRSLINREGYSQEDVRLKRTVRTINSIVINLHYLDDVSKLPPIKDKYNTDWSRMYPSYRNASDELLRDKYTRRACIFNMSHYYDVKDDNKDVIRDGTYPCFLMMQVLYRANNEYDFIVFQRSSDLLKLLDDISFYEYVMIKISRRAKIKITKLSIHMGSCHYEI